ncbi:hypothetical protein BMT55_15725 [Listeria newyorkensis]|uniref:Phage protein n=1 Tax=Listeria newyorkensis TaxID=1497681 RepID=A0ABX4XJ14_9LIST|nr:hypothetical protein [Listeria newyorkensis]PNP88209.1 hypothetical protein BMT55_15725 [Listeria newyorkensis]
MNYSKRVGLVTVKQVKKPLGYDEVETIEIVPCAAQNISTETKVAVFGKVVKHASKIHIQGIANPNRIKIGGKPFEIHGLSHPKNNTVFYIEASL